jgi:hypothetical protein
MDNELRNILFLDIETVGCAGNYGDLPERLKTQWARKASFLKRNENITDEELFYQRAGIYAEFGKIVVIAMGKFSENENGEIGLKTKYLADDDEKNLLIDFKTILEKLDPAAVSMCAHNGKEFDFPYLCRRMLVQDVALPHILNQSGRKPWEVTHLDTLEMWKFGDYKHYTSLDLLATLFNIPTSKSAMDGSQVNDVYYKEQDLTRIAEYCVRDVVALVQLFLKLKGRPIIPSHLISHAE